MVFVVGWGMILKLHMISVAYVIYSRSCIIIPVHDRESMTDLAVLCYIYIYIYIYIYYSHAMLASSTFSASVVCCHGAYLYTENMTYMDNHTSLYDIVEFKLSNRTSTTTLWILYCHCFAFFRNLLIIKGMNKQYKLDSPSILKESP